MTLSHETTNHNSESNSAVATETEPMVNESTSTEQSHAPVAASDSPTHTTQDAAHSAPGEDKHANEDFASALENFTTESEEAVGEDRVIKGTVLKLTATHVVVDIGTKSEGMLPLAEVLDHEGMPKVKPGDEIEVMREKGQTEEGYVNLSHQKAARLHAWDEVEKAHHEKRAVKAVVIERTKGGLTVDVLGARAFLPGSQVDLRPIRNLDGMKGQTLEVTVIKVNKKRGNIVVSRKELLEGEQKASRTKSVARLWSIWKKAQF
jgi:small subunit ribosomal protein S1